MMQQIAHCYFFAKIRHPWQVNMYIIIQFYFTLPDKQRN